MLVYSSILHPSELAEESQPAFLHSLALTLLTQGDLCILHSQDRDDKKLWLDFPHVRETLSQWGRLPAHAPPDAVAALKINIFKMKIPSHDPVEAIGEAVEQRHPDLLVMATHAREGLSRLLHHEVVHPVLKRGGVPALLFPPGCQEFILPATGEVKLDRILVAVGSHPPSQAALDHAAMMARTAASSVGTFREVFVGPASQRPPTVQPPVPGWTWETAELTGSVSEALCEEAQAWPAQLVVMATRRRDTLKDLLLGSSVDRVLPYSPCPVLVVPVG